MEDCTRILERYGSTEAMIIASNPYEMPVGNINVNIHGTAFGGSIFNTCGVAAWGLVNMRLRAEGISAAVVVAKGEISYQAPVHKKIIAFCDLDENDYRDFQLNLTERGKARITLISTAKETDLVQATVVSELAARLIRE